MLASLEILGCIASVSDKVNSTWCSKDSGFNCISQDKSCSDVTRSSAEALHNYVKIFNTKKI